MPRIQLNGFIIVAEDDLEAVLAALPEHIRLTREEPGCLSFQVTQDPSLPTRFDVAEAFDSRPAFERHQARVKTSHWGAVSADVERHYEITEVNVAGEPGDAEGRP